MSKTTTESDIKTAVMIRLSENVMLKLKEISKFKGIPVASVVTEIVCEHVNKIISKE